MTIRLTFLLLSLSFSINLLRPNTNTLFSRNCILIVSLDCIASHSNTQTLKPSPSQPTSHACRRLQHALRRRRPPLRRILSDRKSPPLRPRTHWKNKTSQHLFLRFLDLDLSSPPLSTLFSERGASAVLDQHPMPSASQAMESHHPPIAPKLPPITTHYRYSRLQSRCCSLARYSAKHHVRTFQNHPLLLLRVGTAAAVSMRVPVRGRCDLHQHLQHCSAAVVAPFLAFSRPCTNLFDPR